MKTLLSFGLIVAAVAAHAQIVNGDFEAGATGFASDYATSNIYDFANYVVGTNPNAVHGSWAGMGDHTSGSGKMLIVNGGGVASDAAKAFWKESVSLSAGSYVLSFYGASTYAANPANVQVKLNGNAIGTTGLFNPTAPASPAGWSLYSFAFKVGAGSNLLSLHDLDVNPGGNDFAVDDIKLQAVPEPASMAALGLGALGLLKRRRK